MQDFVTPAIEAFDHATGFGCMSRVQAMLDTKVGTEAIEVVVARRGLAPKAKQTSGELLLLLASKRVIVIGAAGFGSDLGRVDPYKCLSWLLPPLSFLVSKP